MLVADVLQMVSTAVSRAATVTSDCAVHTCSTRALFWASSLCGIAELDGADEKQLRVREVAGGRLSGGCQ